MRFIASLIINSNIPNRVNKIKCILNGNFERKIQRKYAFNTKFKKKKKMNRITINKKLIYPTSPTRRMSKVRAYHIAYRFKAKKTKTFHICTRHKLVQKIPSRRYQVEDIT